MNPIEKALDEVRFEIPAEILEQAFQPQTGMSQELYSLDARIRSEVIEPRVMVDINLHGGSAVYIPLTGHEIEYVDSLTRLYRISAEVLQDRAITQVYSLHYGILGYANMSTSAIMGTGSPILNETSRVLDSQIQRAPIQTHQLNLLNANTVMVRWTVLPAGAVYLNCRISDDDAMGHIRPTAYLDFADLVVAATKQYIYRKLMIRIDQGQLSGGQMLGIFRETISNYAESNQTYRELLRRWKKISMFNDPEERYQYIQLTSNG